MILRLAVGNGKSLKVHGVQTVVLLGITKRFDFVSKVLNELTDSVVDEVTVGPRHGENQIV